MRERCRSGPTPKVGFCFYDWIRTASTMPPQDAVYVRHESVGARTTTAIGDGPLRRVGRHSIHVRSTGQSIDVTDIPDGRYRLCVEVDERELVPRGDAATTTSPSIDLTLATPRRRTGRGALDVIRKGRPAESPIQPVVRSDIDSSSSPSLRCRSRHPSGEMPRFRRTRIREGRMRKLFAARRARHGARRSRCTRGVRGRSPSTTRRVLRSSATRSPYG